MLIRRNHWILTTALATVSCAADSPTPIASEGTVSAAEVGGDSYELTAGDQSRALGISHWVVEGDWFRGLGADQQQVAELRVDHAAQTIESLFPEKGVRGIRDHESNTFSARSQQFLNALRTDLVAAAQVVDSANMTNRPLDGNVDKAQWIFIDCFIQKFDCITVGQMLLFNIPPIISQYSCDLQPFCPQAYPHGLSVLTY